MTLGIPFKETRGWIFLGVVPFLIPCLSQQVTSGPLLMAVEGRRPSPPAPGPRRCAKSHLRGRRSPRPARAKKKPRCHGGASVRFVVCLVLREKSRFVGPMPIPRVSWLLFYGWEQGCQAAMVRTLPQRINQEAATEHDRQPRTSRETFFGW